MKSGVRPNIEVLRPWADMIAKCRSFSDLWSMLDIGEAEPIGALGENFFDELCIQFPHMVGFTDFRPATGREDWDEGTDAVGETYRHVKKGRPARAIRQDKAYNPFVPDNRLDLRHLAALQVPLAQGKVEGRNILICTTLRLDQISLGVRSAYPWILARDHYEPEINGNARFFEGFAKRILEESESMDVRRLQALNAPTPKLMTHQQTALRHASRYKRTFICLPPGSGKTIIQARLAARCCSRITPLSMSRRRLRFSTRTSSRWRGTRASGGSGR